MHEPPYPRSGSPRGSALSPGTGARGHRVDAPRRPALALPVGRPRDPCPHCRGRSIQRWGRFSGRQRYRCTACHRTFSTYTATAMYYVKHMDRWELFLRAMNASLSVRATARYLGIDKDTAFRWRHRVLATARATPPHCLRGRVTLESGWFPYLDKSPIRRRSSGAEAAACHSIGVVLAEDPDRHRLAEVVRANPTSRSFVSLLTGRIDSTVCLVGGRGPFDPLSVAARRLGVRWADGRSGSGARLPGKTLIQRFGRWLEPFRGVSSRYLDRYALWFNALEIGWAKAITHPWVVGARP
jgi:transposase-like protein